MNYLERDSHGIYRSPGRAQRGDQVSAPALMGASTLIGEKVWNLDREALGEIKEIMLDIRTGKIGYAVLTFGGLFTMGEKLLAVPWPALKFDPDENCFTLNVRKERFEDAPGFDIHNWPNMADLAWASRVNRYYQIRE